MKTLKEIKNDYANEQGRDNWEDYFKWLDLCHTSHDVMQKHYDKIAKLYAKEVAKEALKNASENAKTEQGYCSDGWTPSVRIVDKQSILNESNIPKL